MQRYQVCEKLGEGTYGSVWKAKNKQNGHYVAIKELKRKYVSWEDCMALRELKSLQCLPGHDNIVTLNEVIREKDSHLRFVFEFMPDGNLFDLIKRWASDKLSEQILKYNNNDGCSSLKIPPEEHLPSSIMKLSRIQNILKQIFTGLKFIHSHGFIHRDIKPENILIHGNSVKIADFGLARHVSNANTVNRMTDYVSTRWYRAPELLLRAPVYGSAIDIFAVGCVAAELVTFQPLFPGMTELDQINKVFSVLGNNTNWRTMHENDKNSLVDGVDYSSLLSSNNQSLLSSHSIMDMQSNNGSCLSNLVSVDVPFFIPMLESLLNLNPNERITASAALEHPFFLNTSMINHKAGTFSILSSMENRKQLNTSAIQKEHYYTRPSKKIRTVLEPFPKIINEVNTEPQRLTTESAEDLQILTQYNADLVFSSSSYSTKNSTPSLESVRSESSYDSSDIMSCFDDIRKDLLSSDSYGGIKNELQSCSNSVNDLFAELENPSRSTKAFGSDHLFDNFGVPSRKRPRMHDTEQCYLGGFGKSKFRQ